MTACYHCGTPLPTLAPGARFGRRDTCAGCHRDLHACVQCASFEPSARTCQEPSAELVRDREVANFCDWYRPGGRGSRVGQADAAARARAAADALFKPRP